MEDKIISNDFKKYLERLFGKSVKMINSREYETISEIVLNQKNYSGDLKDYDLMDLMLLPNLEKIALKNFIIGKREMDILSSMKWLNHLEFYRCTFSMECKLIDSTLSTLLFDACDNVNAIMIQCTELNTLKIIGLESDKIDFAIEKMQNLRNLENLSINNYKVKNVEGIRENFPNIKNINFDGSIVEDGNRVDFEDIFYSHQERFIEANL